MSPIRYIFSLCVLAMWVLCGIGIANGQWTGIHWIMLGLAHIACAIIFRNFVYVFNYGYGTSMVLVNAAVIAWKPAPAVLLVGGLGILYGIRLILFVYARYSGASYGKIKASSAQANAAVPMPFRLFMWISCSWLMAFVPMAAWVVGNAPATGLAPGVIVGAALMLAGLLFESVADAQKQSAKAAHPARFVSTGLYARIRHPNYLGEIAFQLGLIVAATSAASGAWAVGAGIVGPLYVAILMYYQSIEQDRGQDKRYGKDPDWQAYRERSGSLLPGP